MSQITNNLPDELIRLAGGEVAFVVNFSGGKDSGGRHDCLDSYCCPS
jgi:hypothetical protein